MKRFSFFFVAAFVSVAHGQNLVPNWSFEEYTECPDNGGQLEHATGWVRIQGTPEYYNACATDPAPAVPNNKLGYQAPHWGNAYAGIIVYCDSAWDTFPELLREIIGVALEEPLTPEVPVYVSFWVSPGAFGMPGTQARWTTNGVGLRFTFAPLVSQLGSPAANDANVQLGSILLDTAGWTLVAGTFIPDSAYDAIEIGNFVSDSLLTPYLIDPTGNYGIGYAYVDDVCISQIPNFCGTHLGVNEEAHFQPTVFPDPVVEELHIVVPSNSASVAAAIHDIAGRSMGIHQLTSSSHDRTLDVSYLPEGVYVLHVTDGANSFAPVRFVHVAH